MVQCLDCVRWITRGRLFLLWVGSCGWSVCVLQCFVLCCNVLQYVAVSGLHEMDREWPIVLISGGHARLVSVCAAVFGVVVECVAVCCGVLQRCSVVNF